MKYKVTITEYLQKEIIVDADNEQEAIDTVEDNYYSMHPEEKYILTPDDYITTDFNAEEYEEN